MNRKLMLIVLTALITCTPFLFAEEPPELAPLNPAFIAYKTKAASSELALGEFGLGYFPSPLDLSHLNSLEIINCQLSFPSSYDLRNYGKVTAVRNQGKCGACWAFATIASLESYLMPGDKRDFSENNLKNKHGFDFSCCEGGNKDMATAYLARWDGPVNETDDPYQETSCTSPSGLYPSKHIQDVIYIPGRRNALDNDAIKQALMNFGAVSVSMYWGDSYWNSSNSAYYYYGGEDPNHLVAIIGWDDNFPGSRFKVAPPGNGAFLIRNSWGTNFGNSGYFWISYYDTVLALDEGAVFTAGTTADYQTIYQYDTFGATSALGYTSSNTAWCANMFTSDKVQLLNAVSTYFLANGTTYELYIYTNCSASSPRSGTLAYSKSGTANYAGYHTIVLDQPVSLSAGQVFSIVFKLTTPNYSYPIPIELPISGYCSSATASAGQSFCSSTGSSWSDVTSYYPGTNVCVKGFFGTASVPPPVITSMAKKSDPFRIIIYGSNFQNYITVLITNIYFSNYQWSNGYIKDTTKIVLKGGSALKTVVPKNTPTTFTLINPDGGQCSYVWQWP